MASQDESQAAFDEGLRQSYSAKSLASTVAVVIRTYSDFCDAEDIPLFPFVADVVVIFLHDFAYSRAYARTVFNIFEHGRLAMHFLWKEVPGVSSLDSALGASPVALLIKSSDPTNEAVTRTSGSTRM